VLALASLLISHEVAYHSHHGGGAEFEARMAALGHDAYWPAFTLLALSATIVLALVGTARLLRLWLRLWLPARGLGMPARLDRVRPRPYRRELARLWATLFPTTVLAFAVQENVEHLLAGNGLIWLGALGGHEYPLALPVLALVTLIVAAVGAAARRHSARLEARIVRELWQRRMLPHRRTPLPLSWLIVSALCARDRLRAHRLLVRAPPSALRI
jgi:hypothetical protein